MNLYHLRYFTVLARLEHYTRAAAELNITQPSLSHAISALEEELGVPLFERTGRNVTLTKYGKLFLRDVEQALTALDQGVDRLQRVRSGREVIDLGFLRGMGTNLVPELISGFQATSAGQKVEFRLVTDTTKGLLDSLAAGRCDLIFCSRAHAPEAAFFPVSHRPLSLVVPEGHPLAQYDHLKLEDTLDYPHIIFTKTAGIRAEIDRLYARLPRMPVIAYEIQEDQDIAGLVAHGFGVAVLPWMYLLNTLPVKVVALDEADVQRYIYLAAPQGRYLSPAVTAFRDFVLQWARDGGV